MTTESIWLQNLYTTFLHIHPTYILNKLLQHFWTKHSVIGLPLNIRLLSYPAYQLLPIFGIKIRLLRYLQKHWQLQLLQNAKQIVNFHPICTHADYSTCKPWLLRPYCCRPDYCDPGYGKMPLYNTPKNSNLLKTNKTMDPTCIVLS